MKGRAEDASEVAVPKPKLSDPRLRIDRYAEAGVDIAAGDRAVDEIRDVVARSNARPGVMGALGGFGGLFHLADINKRYADPVLVSSADGVGTKAVVAAAADGYDTIGYDLVAMCVDDLACTGAEPLFFLDYLALGVLNPDLAARIVGGIAMACTDVGAALIGGEMAEHPNAMAAGQFDLAGFAVGVVERERMLPQRVEPGLVLLGLLSPGLRSNGYSLARKVLLTEAGRKWNDPAWEGAAETVGEVLRLPSVLYSPATQALTRSIDVRLLAHITGGGMQAKLGRVLPKESADGAGDGVDAVIDEAAWKPPPIFGEISTLGQVGAEEMRRVFNMGIGMVAAVPADQVESAREVLASQGLEQVPAIGVTESGAGVVRYCQSVRL